MPTLANSSLSWPGGDCRLFVGVALHAMQQQQMADLLAQIPAALKPVPAQNLHLTLRFLGQSNERQARQLWQQLSFQALPVFTVQLDELLCWPGPRVLCLAGAIADPALSQLDDLIAQAATAAGYAAPQHPLHPHLTLARNARQVLPLQWSPLQLRPTALHLYQSRSTPAGVRYLPLASLPLLTTDS